MTVVFLTAVVAEMSRELPRSARVFLFQSLLLELDWCTGTCDGVRHPESNAVCRVWLCPWSLRLSCVTLQRSGLLALLDEECLVPRGSDDGYARKLYSTAAIKTHPRFTATPKHQVRCVAGVGTP